MSRHTCCSHGVSLLLSAGLSSWKTFFNFFFWHLFEVSFVLAILFFTSRFWVDWRKIFQKNAQRYKRSIGKVKVITKLQFLKIIAFPCFLLCIGAWVKTLILSSRKVKVFQLIIINFSFVCGFYGHCLIRAVAKITCKYMC